MITTTTQFAELGTPYVVPPTLIIMPLTWTIVLEMDARLILPQTCLILFQLEGHE